jgi:DNA-binding NarL/FixJ family response regulator
MSPDRQRSRIRLVIVDDHPLMRDGTRRALAKMSDIEVVGEAANGETACAMVAQLRPDVLLLDVRLPDLSGIEVARRVRAAFPKVALVVLTGYDDAGYRRELLRIGVSGYLSKSASASEVADAIRAAAKGALLPGGEVTEAESPDDGEGLTERERQVLHYLVAGRRNAEIAETMVVSQKTVEFHISHILQKLGVRSRAEAISCALRRGLVDQL